MARSTPQSSQRYPLTQVLGTETNVRLLRALTLHGGQLSAPSLVSRTGLAKGSVRSGLNVLLELGAVTVKGSGHAQLYNLRPDYPLRAPVEALFEAESARFQAIYDEIRQAAENCKPAPTATYIYGSFSRGQDKPDSDLDILVIVDDEVAVSSVACAMREALQEPGERIGFVPSVIGLSLSDVMRHMRDAQSYWRGALQTATVVSGKGPASLARLQSSIKRECLA